MIGTIINDTYVKNEKENGKLRMAGGAWSIPWKICCKVHVSNILYRTPKVLYTITMDKALQSGFALTLGGEAKLVVPIRHWNKVAK